LIISSSSPLARNLLTDDGVIFISIDDNEVDNLKKICNEVFGEDNFVAQLIWERAYSPKNDARYISNSHDYVLMYAKNLNEFTIGRLPRTKEANARYSNPDNDPRGVWKPGDMSVKTYSEAYDYPITLPSGKIVEPPTGRCWRFPRNAYEEAVKDNRIWFGANGDSVPQVKRFLSELKYDGMAPTSIMFYKDVGHSQEGAKEVTALLEAGAFEGPKPVRMLRRLLILANLEQNDVILDFFSGSATTAHAVMQLNAEDYGNRKFIMVQLPEPTDEKSEAHKAGYMNICEIGKERIRRAGEKIKEENKDKENIENLDIGFKVLKLDTSNIRKWQPDYDNLEQSILDYVDNYVEGRTELDVVYEIMLKYGLDLTYPIDEFTIADKKVYSIGFGMLMICLDDEITTEVARGILAKSKELSPESTRVVFKDNGFKTDSNKTNIKEILKAGGIEEFITI
jgi:adenine-specific DNA-methyltransferase